MHKWLPIKNRITKKLRQLETVCHLSSRFTCKHIPMHRIVSCFYKSRTYILITYYNMMRSHALTNFPITISQIKLTSYRSFSCYTRNVMETAENLKNVSIRILTMKERIYKAFAKNWQCSQVIINIIIDHRIR